MPEKNEQIIIIGAGPVGLEAALYARTLGYDVQVLEKRDVANHIRQWQHVRLFSPFSMNHTALGKKLLTENGVALPGDDEYLTGGEFVDRYLAPLAKSDALRDGVVTNCEVIAISRERTLKSDHIGDGERKKQPFHPERTAIPTGWATAAFPRWASWPIAPGLSIIWKTCAVGQKTNI